MPKCKLYIRAGANDAYIGEYPSKEAAEKYYKLIKSDIQKLYGYTVKAQPIYIQQGKAKK